MLPKTNSLSYLGIGALTRLDRYVTIFLRFPPIASVLKYMRCGWTKKTSTFASTYLLFLLTSSPSFLFCQNFKKNLIEKSHKRTGSFLSYDYDEDGNLTAVQASDGSAAYAYRYNSQGQIIETINLKTGEKVERLYDSQGNFIEEKFPAGFVLKNEYDEQGKRIKLTLPDSSFVQYCYEKSTLHQVKRFSKTGDPLYEHTYLSYNSYGRPTEERLIGNLGIVTSSFDERGRLVCLSSPLGTEEVDEFDEGENIKKLKQFSGTAFFTYDEKDQILSYDAFDRLTHIEKPKEFLLIFTYDGFHRRLTESRYEWTNSGWQKLKILHFLYDNQNEIGAFDEDGALVELRVLGLSSKADISAPIAIELDQKTFAPLYDICGNVAALQSLEMGNLESPFSNLGTWLGTAIQQYCYHIVPFPGIRNLGIYVGELLGAEPIPKSHFECFSGSVGACKAQKNHVNVWINGANTNLVDTVQFAEIISKACGGEKVYYAYNCTKGFAADIWEHIAGKLYFQTAALFVAIGAIRQAIEEVGGVGKGGRVTIFAHSQGGFILSRALQALTKEEQNMLQVYTLGTASLFCKGDLLELQHIVSERDRIPFLADPMRYLLAYVWDPSLIRFINSEDGGLFDNHAFLSPAYQQEIIRIGTELQLQLN